MLWHSLANSSFEVLQVGSPMSIPLERPMLAFMSELRKEKSNQSQLFGEVQTIMVFRPHEVFPINLYKQIEMLLDCLCKVSWLDAVLYFAQLKQSHHVEGGYHTNNVFLFRPSNHMRLDDPLQKASKNG
jgi:hypothetical protein